MKHSQFQSDKEKNNPNTVNNSKCLGTGQDLCGSMKKTLVNLLLVNC